MLIGITGFVGVGKSTAASFFINKGFIPLSFATPLKDAVALLFGWDREMVEGSTEESRAWREQPDLFWSEKFGYSISPREVLQKFGTESMRNVFHSDFWIIKLFQNLDPNKNYVVADVRFPNEGEAIRLAGGYILKIQSPTQKEAAYAHSSETQQHLINTDHVITNYKDEVFFQDLADAYDKFHWLDTVTRSVRSELRTPDRVPRQSDLL